MNDCIFCTLSHDPVQVQWENEFFFMMFDSFPVNPGHALIIPKRHVVNISDLNIEEWQELQPTIKAIIAYIKKTDLRLLYEQKVQYPLSEISLEFCQKALSSPYLNSIPDAFNHGINDGTSAGRTVNHLHWHIIPRFQGDMDDPRGGVRYVIPQKGNYKI